jgi:hypothetical protein
MQYKILIPMGKLLMLQGGLAMNTDCDNNDKDITELRSQVEYLATIVHGAQFTEYLDLINDTRRLLIMNFILGLTRGLGMAIGFTLLGALVFYFLKQIIVLNLPLISDFIADIVRLVQMQSI